ncbi:hypothetical protein EA187_18745 [Lujinxingia sediminis]|uniref:Uncharacterized protein n=1 Tax=Lujinxingia sediminis TaxID=2480984 RepID=A0ABY0CNF6_9DELT|nr:hypothetical protein [Lujinxingia sediminis]RVU41383.1 hypothetical protein EA187_18745 [Lujinxingia sediminis]
MTQASPQIGPLGSTIEVPSLAQHTLSHLLATSGFDRVHFFIREGVDAGAIDAPPPEGDALKLALLDYTHPLDIIDDAVFEHIEAADVQPATLRDLLCFAIAHPGAQLEHDIVATGTMRTRHVYGSEREGETTWAHTHRDRTICQWITGLTHTGTRRELVPLELYLKDLLRQPAKILVRLG